MPRPKKYQTKPKVGGDKLLEAAEKAHEASAAQLELAERRAKMALDDLKSIGNPYDRYAGNLPGPWTKRTEESNAAYTAFDLFRRIGPGRNLTKTAEKVREIRQQKYLKSLGSDKADFGLQSASEDDVSPDVSSEIDMVSNGIESSGGGESVPPSPQTTQNHGDTSNIDPQVPIDGSATLIDPRTGSIYVPAGPRKISLGRISLWAKKFDWWNRARAWDDHVHEQQRAEEESLRQRESVEAAQWQRIIRQKNLRIVIGLLNRVLEAIESDTDWAPKDLRDLTLAAERSGLIQQNAFKGVRDLLEDRDGSESLPMEVAAKLALAMAEVSLGGPQLAPALSPPLAIEVTGH